MPARERKMEEDVNDECLPIDDKPGVNDDCLLSAFACLVWFGCGERFEDAADFPIIAIFGDWRIFESSLHWTSLRGNMPFHEGGCPMGPYTHYFSPNFAGKKIEKNLQCILTLSHSSQLYEIILVHICEFNLIHYHILVTRRDETPIIYFSVWEINIRKIY